MIENTSDILRVPEMLTLKEASRRTGLSYELLRQLCLSGQIVHIRSGAKYLVNLDRLIDFMNAGGDAHAAE